MARASAGAFTSTAHHHVMPPMLRASFLLLLSVVLPLPKRCAPCRIIAYAGEEEASARRLLLEAENGLPALAFSQPHRWDTLLRATTLSDHWDLEQCEKRNAQENRDGWGVGWWEDDQAVPRRYRTAESLVSAHSNDTSPDFEALLRGAKPVARVSLASGSGGGFSHSQGFLGMSSSREVGSCGEELLETGDGGNGGDGFATASRDVVRGTGKEVESRVIFGHVRAATSSISTTNSHPFIFNRLLWMHNGALSDFESYRGTLLRRLRPAVRGLLAGDVDSEHAGALFVNNLEGFPERREGFSMAELRGAMRATIAELRALSAEAALEALINATTLMDAANPASSAAASSSSSSSSSFNSLSPASASPASSPLSWAPSSMNFVVSDGEGLIVTRFRSSRNQDPPSLYYKVGLSDRYRSEAPSSSSSSNKETTSNGGGGGGSGGVRYANALTVASEPLEVTEPALSAWRLLGKDRMISFHPDEGVKVECVSDQCTPDVHADFGAVQEA